MTSRTSPPGPAAAFESGCEMAESQTERTIADFDSSGGAESLLGDGAKVGRYVVLTRIGAGSMGIVYAAYDPELDRKVALKLLRRAYAQRGAPDRSNSPADRARTRLLREAQALAGLSHPNIVAVHDVGTVDDQVFIAMEFIEGQTLAGWIGAEPRPWRETMRVVLDAGRGLAAAHDKSIVHRDFKPENVMIDLDGRIRVMDFGLARRASTDSEPNRSGDIPPRAIPSLDAHELPATQFGALVGTPAFMSPEQLSSETASAASDQFSFCVTAWLAFYGEPPFTGRTLPELAAAVMASEPTVPSTPRARKVPARVQRILRRGLSREPEHRYPRMSDLLEALAAIQPGLRRRALAIGLTLPLVSLGVILAWQRADVAQQTAECRAASDAITLQTWTAETKSALHAAMISTRLPYAEVTAQKVVPWLDEYADDWSEASYQFCMDTEVKQVWNDDLAPRASACLEQRREDYQALVSQLLVPDDATVRSAISAVSGLRPVAPCLDRSALSRHPRPSAQQNQSKEVRAKLSRVSALRLSTNYESALGLADEALADAERIGWLPLTVSARSERARVLQQKQDSRAAAETWERVYLEAVESEMDDVAADAAIALTLVSYDATANAALAELWYRQAQSLLRVLGQQDSGQRHLVLARHRATVLTHLDDSDAARALVEHVAVATERDLGPEHPSLADALHQLAGVHYGDGDYRAAQHLLERALRLQRDNFGDKHPRVASELEGLALMHQGQGEYARAAELYEEALVVVEEVFGPSHETFAKALGNYGVVQANLDRPEEAKRSFERALGIMEAALGPDHPDLAYALENLADLELAEEQLEAARALVERALANRRTALGSEHTLVAVSMVRLGNIDLEIGALDSAAAQFEGALEIFSTPEGAHPYAAYPLNGLAEVAVRRERWSEAVSLSERALAVLESGDEPPETRAEQSFTLARALLGARRGEEAEGVGRRARSFALDAGENGAELLEKIDTWLGGLRPR